MRKLLYKLFAFLSQKLGRWIFVIFAWFVATGYFLFFPPRVANSVELYRRLYPNRGRGYHLWCAWRQFHNFTDVFLDRFLLQQWDQITYTSENLEFLQQALDSGQGAVLLMSHMGNWEVAVHLLKHKLKHIRLLLYMGAKQKEQIEQIQKQALDQSGIRIVAVAEQGGSALDIVDGIRFIRTGGVVSLAGDIVWKRDQRAIPVKFLGREILLPQAPHLLALASGAPLFIFFAFRTGKNQYHFSMSAPICPAAVSRSQRTAALRQSAQKYADTLEATLHRYPLQWYHFKPLRTPKSA